MTLHNVAQPFRAAPAAIGRPAAFAPAALRRASPKLASIPGERRREGLRYTTPLAFALLLSAASAAYAQAPAAAATPPEDEGIPV